MTKVIELDGLSVRYGRHEVLKSLTGSFNGRSIGLLGPNGAGKTTLLHCLLGFHEPTEGTARIFGLDTKTQGKQIREQIGYMPERDAFVAGMSAVRLTRLMGELSGLPSRDALERAHEALYYVGLNEARYRPLGGYSLGMKQMAKLAQAIVHGPKLLFLDEPTNGLDPPHRARMIRLIREIRDSGKANIIISSHLLRDVEECCDEVLILKDGEIATYCNLEDERRANLKFIEIETQRGNSLFADAIGNLGCEVAVLSDRKLKTVLPESVSVRDLYKIAAEHQMMIRRLDYKRDSLQDIFLKAMGVSHGGI
jgi:ABC-2 type transport system ATP-binding protein